jgi:hypothetical protein
MTVKRCRLLSAGEELTFDYLDEDEGEEVDVDMSLEA